MWAERAACVGYPDSWWMVPECPDEQTRRGNAAAVRVCAACPVKRECLADAHVTQDIGVIRGGRRLSAGHRPMAPVEVRRCRWVLCSAVFVGEPNQRYCRPQCKRAMEHARSQRVIV